MADLAVQVNDLDLKNWKEYTDLNLESLWLIPERDNTGVHSEINGETFHGAFVPQIASNFISRFTRRGQVVLDLFCGSGTSLVESQRSGRHATGFDINPEAVELSNKLLSMEPNPYNVTCEAKVGNSCTHDVYDQYHGRADLIFMHPPYWNIIQFSDKKEDMSNMNYKEFMEAFDIATKTAIGLLNEGGHLVLVMGDAYQKETYYPLGFYCMQIVANYPRMKLRSIVVKNFGETKAKGKNKNLWKYRALANGLFVFAHEYIFLFKRI